MKSRLLLAAKAGSMMADAALGRAQVRFLVPDVGRARRACSAAAARLLARARRRLTLLFEVVAWRGGWRGE